MATEDVIELGSSEDDAEPAPKKTKNIPTNAMVHIPSKLPELTIKPTKDKGAPGRPAPKNQQLGPTVLATGLTMTKVKTLPEAGKSISAASVKINGRPLARLQAPLILPISSVKLGKNPLQSALSQVPRYKTPVNKRVVNPNNPMNIMNKFNNTQLKINKVSVASTPNTLRCPIKVHSPRSLNKLPPDITIVRKGGSKRPLPSSAHIATKKLKRNLKNPATTVETVDLDDDEINQASTSSPQWYLRPEEQTESDANDYKKTDEDLLEVKVNTNVESSKMIEIIIEDSPIKTVTEKEPLDSDGERSDVDKEETPRSRKKLNYPNKTEGIGNVAAIEIEIEPMEYTESNACNAVTVNECSMSDSVVEILESPAKPMQNLESSTPKKDDAKRPEITPKYMEPFAQTSSDEEFHPIYQKFIDLCFKLENSEDMRKIVEKKIKAYYKQVPKEYTTSEDFIDMVSSKIVAMEANPDKMYLFIKDIVDELNMQRKMAKTQPPTNRDKSTALEKFQFPEESEFDAKRQRQIRKLEKTIKKLHRAIQKLEEQEVDFDDEEDSVYILTERYKERMIRVHAKFCQLTNTKLPSEPRVIIEARPGQPTGPVKRLEKWVNRKVPIGSPLPFPDFHDVLRCVREANEEDKLGWNEADIIEEARDLFIRCGKKLQRRRQENEWRLAASRICVDLDPAEQNAELQKKLADNKQVATKRETDVFNKFADRQSQLKLEPEEIGDNEAEESPVDDDEGEESNEDGSNLQDKEKRKERIKKLIQINQKKKTVKEQENKSKEADEICIEKAVDKNKSKFEDTENEGKKNEESGAVSNNDDTEVNKELSKPINRIHSISDDSDKIQSDVDELNLLQKLYSENEMNSSTIESTGTDTPIDISDSLSSSDKDKNSNDVISIENSSYSESELNKDVDNHDVEEEILPKITTSTELGQPNRIFDAQVYNSIAQTSNDEYNDPIGNILLASSEDELSDQNHSENEEICMNLQDDALSIGETVVQEIVSKNSVDVESEYREINENDAVEQFSEEDNNIVSSGSVNTGHVVLEKQQGQSDGDTIGASIDMFSSFDKNSGKSVAPVNSADKVFEENTATIPKGNDQENNDINEVTVITSDSNSPEMVHERQSKESNKVAHKDIEMPDTEEKVLNNEKDVENPKIDIEVVAQCNKDGMEINDTEPIIGVSTGHVVLEKQQGQSDGEVISGTVDMISSFDKKSGEFVAPVNSADEVFQEDTAIIPKLNDHENNDINEVKLITSNSNSPEMVNEGLSKESNKVAHEDIVMPNTEQKVLNNEKDVENPKIEIEVVAQCNKDGMEINDTEPTIGETIIDEPMECAQRNVVSKNKASQIATLDSTVKTKDSAKVSNLDTTDDSLEALLEELHSDLGNNNT